MNYSSYIYPHSIAESPPKKRKLSSPEPSINRILDTPASPTDDLDESLTTKDENMDASSSEPKSVIKSLASTKVKEEITSLAELTDKIQNDQDEIVDIEMDSTPEQANTTKQKSTTESSSSSSSNSSGSSSSSSSTQSDATPSTKSSSIIAPPPPPPPLQAPSETSERLSNSDLHKNIETNIEKILDCFTEDKITDSPLSPPLPSTSAVATSSSSSSASSSCKH